MRRIGAVASQCRRFAVKGWICSYSLMKSSNDRRVMVSHAYSVSCLEFSTHTRVLRQSWAQRKLRQWMCLKTECRSINKASATNCEACGTAKPVIKGWLCTECQTRNYDGVKKCHKCKSELGFSREFWMCVACEKNNRVDDLDDNSRCGFCGYDMAPMSMTEEDAQRIANERSERLRDAQQEFDRLSAADAEEQFGDDAAGASSLPEAVRLSAAAVGMAGLKVPEVKPFAPAPFATAHSRIGHKRRPLPPAGTPTGPPGFDWMCRDAHCGTVNPGDEETCSQCAAHVAPAEWECVHCAAMNHLSRARCFNCQVTIPVSWVCGTCRTATSIYDRACRQCGTTRPPAEPKEARDVHASAGRLSTSGQRARRNDWYCRECQGLNFASRTACFQCGAARGSAEAAPMSGSGGDVQEMGDAALSHNNWFCRHCQASNFRTRASCWQCGHASSESGATAWSEDTDAPRFEREGFQPDTDDERVADGQVNVWDKKADDWTCGKCFTKNFKNRMECHKCGSKKTVAVAPRRAFVRKPVKI